MNDIKRNIVISYWDKDSVKNRLNICDVKEQKCDLDIRFPYLEFIENIKNLKTKMV